MTQPAEPTANLPPPPAAGRRWMWAFAGALLLAALFVALRVPAVRQHVGQYVREALDSIRALGPWGPLCFGALFVGTTLGMISSSLMITMAGFLFGLRGGFLPVTVGFTLGAAAAFALGRTLLRGWVQRKTAGHPLLGALDKAVAEKGFRVVLLVRLTPAPSVLMNYAFGLTKVRFRPYVLGTLLGMIPRTFTYLYVGSTLKSAADIVAGGHERGPLFWIHLGAGALVAVVVVVLVSRMAHKKLRETLDRCGGK